MGQKVNPKGLRIGVIYNWESRWYFSNKHTFRESLVADVALRMTIMKKYSFTGVTQVDIERAINKITVVIYSVKPGMIIGRGGKGLEELKALVLKQLRKPGVTKDKKELKVELKIEPVKKPYLNGYYVAQSIAERLVRGFSHRSVIHNTMDRVMEAGARGIKIQLGGRINGAEISRREKYFKGTVPVSTIREDVDFARFPALTKSGYIGVKVWICR